MIYTWLACHYNMYLKNEQNNSTLVFGFYDVDLKYKWPKICSSKKSPEDGGGKALFYVYAFAAKY